jgi:HlyD family secretion protein
MSEAKKKKTGLIILLIVIAVFILAITYLMPGKTPKGILQTSGIIEATEVNLSSKLTERLKEVNVQEGDYIKENDVVVKLDDEKRKAEYGQAVANLEVAKANILTAAAEVKKAEVKIEDTKRDLERQSKLLEKNLVSQNDQDKAKTNYDLSLADLNKAKAQETLAQAGVRQQEAALNLAQENLNDTVITSTISGAVILKAFEPGEMVSAGTVILTVVDTKNIWARADVEETSIAQIKLGDTAYVKADALPSEEFIGRVAEINSEGEFATQRDVKRGKQDIKTFRVKVKIDEPKGILKPGMSVQVRFILGK